ncbi:hypothetical protein DV495_000926 [Geotrichum candidum]|uniref:chitinase n=1 Tax=Geotrichum candidum TaxID=1173061 RepID=A0A0J9X4I7_GEOCN|nr:hypothetical protein DV495_000926 [Geotrichum candidum]KAF7501173.1 hypothetical protein DV113_000745 [Geotrichum candidum]KAI8136104.1 hypothetical protein DUD61_000260 [Geotrichum candidum]CDO52345.1 similar to Saccharomyces cerevisiae YLR286C CTS1 Endochitinase [Geotrichum candidum]
MKFNLQKVSTALLSLLPAVDAFSASGSNNVVLYWGQASAGSQESLGTYCESTSADMYVLSFLAGFPESKLTIHGCAGTLASSCPDLAADIKYCQSLGKKVLLSLGGAVGSYGFTSDQQAINYASTLWNSFGGGTSTQRPFGDAVLDGFDLDIENGDPTGYAALTTALRKLYAGGDYYIGAAPQCVYPDASLSTALANGYFDFVFVQFYNNKCSIDGSFNWATWAKYAADYAASTNPNVKLYLGLPGSSSAASSGYASISSIQSVLATIQSSKYFGGVMLWDASQAFSNVVNGVSFVSSLKALLTLGSSDSVAGESSPALSAAVPKASSSAKQSGSLAASATVVYNEWGYPVVASSSSSAASASATVVYNEWGYPVVASPSSSAAANQWVAASSSAVASSSAAANQWVAASSSAVVNEWAAATSTVVESVAATTVVAVEAAASSTNQESESAGNVNNGLWNPDTSAKPDDGYWKTGKYEGGSVNKLVVGDLPVKKEVSLSSTASSLSKSFSVASSAASTTDFAAASSSTAALSSTSAAVSSSVDAVSSTSAVASSSTVAVSSTSAVVSSSTSAVVSSSSAAVSSTSAAASSSTVALSSTPVAVESISSSAPTISDAAVEPTYSPITSTITITTTSIPTSIPSASISSAPKSSFLFSSFTTVRSAAPAVSSSAQTSTVATTSVAPVFSNTVVSAESTLASSTSVKSATLTKTSASESTSQSVTKSLKVVNAASVPDRCNDRSQGHLDSCLNTLFETEKQPVELAANDVTDSNASAALPEVGVITQANSASSDNEQGDGLACTREGAVTCKDGKFAICNFNKWVLFDCPASTTCKALTINDIETVVGCNWV